MSLRDTIRKATGAVVPKLLTGLAGSTVTTTRNVRTRDAAQRTVLTPAHPITGGSWYIKEIADAHVQRVWGATSGAQAEAAVPLGTDVAEDDVVTVTAGDFAGKVYEIEQLRHDPLGSRILIALGPTGQPA
jgi:hypothetical protein